MELTTEQEGALKEYSQKWLRHGLSTEPIDKSRVRADMKLVYESAGIEFPNVIIYLESPGAANCLLTIIENEGEWDVDDPTKMTLEYLKTYCEKFDVVKSYARTACYGQFDSSWIAFYDFCLNELGMDCCKKMQGLINCAENVGMYWPASEFVIVTSRPSSITQGIIKYRDGWQCEIPKIDN